MLKTKMPVACDESTLKEELNMRMLHTMLRVGNLERSLAFYTEVLGMRLLRKHDYPDGKFTLAFVGYQDEQEGAVLELTHNWGVDATTSWAPPTVISRSRLAMRKRLARISALVAAKWCARRGR